MHFMQSVIIPKTLHTFFGESSVASTLANETPLFFKAAAAFS